jgi:hypothetical protein
MAAGSVDAPSLDEFSRSLTAAGWRVLSANPGFGFGSWSIELAWVVRVSYNGRDGLLLVERQTSRDNWRLVWSASDRGGQTPEVLLTELERLGLTPKG